MGDIKKWANDHALNNDMEYDELVIKVLEGYRNYVENDKELYEYVREDKFRMVIKELYNILNKSSNTWSISNVKNINDKISYCNKYNEKLEEKVLKGDCEILKIKNNGVIIAYCILSYENDIYGKYAFLHKINFIKDFDLKQYNIIESEIARYVKNKSCMYLDRVIVNSDENNIRKMGYCILAQSMSVKISISDYVTDNIEYKSKKCERKDNSYYAISSIVPLRFEEKLENCYEISFHEGKFYISFNIIDDWSIVHIYIFNFKDYYRYLEKIYKIIDNFMFNRGVKNIYTSVPIQHIILLNKNNKAIKKMFWIRKNI
ncbi:hypothetical protein [Clostridium rectalis]|uniref:hypothetical protein n=1 Tax=Clostridium rectalis TaxID=2040295 RepID=UPI000F630697|nr:hypothetical protein [Clostridium rectalis]